MNVDKAVKKYKMERCSEPISKLKASELNVDDVLYMNVQKNSYAYIVKNGPFLYLYHDKKDLYTKLYKGLRIEKLEN